MKSAPDGGAAIAHRLWPDSELALRKAHQMVCNRPDLLKAIVSVAAGLVFADCASAQPVLPGAASLAITSSTMRGKENFRPLPNAATLIDNLKGLEFNWIDQPGGTSDVGVFPFGDAATSIPALLNWDIPGLSAQGVNNDRVVPVLVEAFKHVHGEVEDSFSLLVTLAEDVTSLTATVREHQTRLTEHDTRLAGLQAQVAAQEATITLLQKKAQDLEARDEQLEQEIQALKAAVAALGTGAN